MHAQIPAEDHVLSQPEGHPDRCGPKAKVESEAGLQQPGDQRPGKSAKVDAQVEQRETAVATWITLVIERSEERRSVGLERTRAQSDQHQADRHPAQTGQNRQRDVTAHDDDAAVERGPFHPQHPVGHPPAQHGGEVNQTAVGTDDAGGGRLGQAQSTVGHRVIEVVPEDGEHPVERETLP